MSNATTTPVWTPDDSKAADQQGWGIFETNRDLESANDIVNGKRYGFRQFEIQRDDEQAVFADDQAAHAFVLAAANKGDALSIRALAYLAVYSPHEHAAIVGEVKDPIRVFHALSNVELTFAGSVGASYAVAYGYCEENHRMSELFSHQQDGKLDELLAKLPMTYGKQSVGCGDWMAAVR